MPTVYGLMIAFSFVLVLGLIHSSIALIAYTEIKETDLITECYDTYNKELETESFCDEIEIYTTKKCTWNLLIFAQECDVRNTDRFWWEVELLSSIVFSAIWFSLIFYHYNGKKRWVQVKWIE